MNTFITLLSGWGIPLLQPDATNDFFIWYFYGLGGIGGWVIFLLLAFAAVIWLLYDSLSRRLSAVGWRLAVITLLLLVAPSMLYRFTVNPVHYQQYRLLEVYRNECRIEMFARFSPTVASCDQLRSSLPVMTPYSELVFYLGLLGGVLALVTAAGYLISYQGMTGCIHGHVYEAILGKCPECAAEEAIRNPPVVVTPPVEYGGAKEHSGIDKSPRRPTRPCLNYAWLVDMENNRRFDLYEGATLIGRSANVDIALADPAVSREHAKIRETQGRLTLSDLDSSSGTYLNGRRMRAPQVLQNGDRITVGDTEMQFVTTTN